MSTGSSSSELSHDELIGTNSAGIEDALERNIISGNTDDGIQFSDIASGGTADDDTVAGNYIGTDDTGTQRLGNGQYGIAFLGGGTGNLIGVNSQAAVPVDGRNIIAGNGGGILLTTQGSEPLSQTVVSGNYIGTDASGEIALGNGELGGITVENATGTLIGTSGDGVAAAIEGNVISNNTRYGVGVLSGGTNTIVAGNLIGTDAGGSVPMGNTGPGVLVWSSVATQVGGRGDLGNVIAYSARLNSTALLIPEMASASSAI